MEEVIHVFDWFQLASNKEKRMVQLRRYLHQYPELSFEEKRTHDFIVNQLSQLACTIETPVGRNGIKATFKGSIQMAQRLHCEQISMHYLFKN